MSNEEFENWCESQYGFQSSRLCMLLGTDLRAAYRAATASKQREIDSLQRANESERGLNDALQRQVNGLNQQVLELSVQVNDLRETLETTVPFIGYQAHVPHIVAMAERALYATPPAALEAHDNEAAAKALEGVLLEINATPSLQLSERQREAIRRIVESRSKK